jgi:very-short-patch-repair endonuclease
VLFATKNNPAIDVVMEKLHRTVEQNIAVRTGSGVYQTALARYLYEMSSESAPPHQLEALDELGARYQQIEENLTDLDEQISEFLSSTCLLNESQKQVESCISAYGNDLFDLICEDLDEISRMCSSLKADCEAAQFKNQPIFKKLFWLLLKSGAKRKCIERLICAHKDYPALFHQEDNIEQVQAQIEPLDKTITTIQLWNQRKSAVKKAASLETLTKKRLELEDERTDIAAKIWRKYNKTRSARLSRADREKLSQSGVVLKMLSSHTGDGPMGSELFAKFSQMTRTMSHLVPLWATTSLSVRGRIPFHGSFFDLVVLDETGQADIASCLPLLYRARRAVVVGDPKQLSHISHISQAHDPVLLKRYGLLESNSQFSYSANSMYDLAASCVEPSDIIQFRDHHRSHKDIIGFSNQHFYGGNLHISTSENKLVSLPGQQQALNWIDVDGQAERPSSGSLVNPKEAKAVVNTLRQQVFNHGYAGSIGVVSPFRAQVNLIRRYVNKDHELTEALEQRNFLVDTVHKFQGDERDWILFSSVLSSSGVTSGAHRFLANNGNLFNVAITRARASLTIFGSKKGLEQFPVEYLQAFYDYVKGIKESGMSSHPTPNAMKTDKSSAWEEKFYCALKDAGIEVLPQWSEDKYELDFALFNGTNKLDIEVDGQAYHENAGGGLSIKDQERNHRLMRLGWDVMRFWVFELREDMQGCVGRVEEWLHINGSKTGKLKN